jgi:hypothetical protein
MIKFGNLTKKKKNNFKGHSPTQSYRVKNLIFQEKSRNSLSADYLFGRVSIAKEVKVSDF